MAVAGGSLVQHRSRPGHVVGGLESLPPEVAARLLLYVPLPGLFGLAASSSTLTTQCALDLQGEKHHLRQTLEAREAWVLASSPTWLECKAEARRFHLSLPPESHYGLDSDSSGYDSEGNYIPAGRFGHYAEAPEAPYDREYWYAGYGWGSRYEIHRHIMSQAQRTTDFGVSRIMDLQRRQRLFRTANREVPPGIHRVW